jgi:SAM-dependent methyltransferase
MALASTLVEVRDPRKQIVLDGYEATAEAYAHARSGSAGRAWVERLIAEVPARARVLDLGCGNGWPIAAALADAGFAVTGVDLSPAQIRRARVRVPGGRFVVGDMTELRFDAREFGGAIAWDAVFHVPPEEQAALFARIHGWLAPRAPFVVTLGATDGELHTAHLGAPMYYGALDPTVALRALADAGFAAVEHTIDDASGGGHLVAFMRA